VVQKTATVGKEPDTINDLSYQICSDPALYDLKKTVWLIVGLKGYPPARR
jgi:hypothetical protein